MSDPSECRKASCWAGSTARKENHQYLPRESSTNGDGLGRHAIITKHRSLVRFETLAVGSAFVATMHSTIVWTEANTWREKLVKRSSAERQRPAFARRSFSQTASSLTIISKETLGSKPVCSLMRSIAKSSFGRMTSLKLTLPKPSSCPGG